MKKIIIASDFDGTITKCDSLFDFFKTFAKPEWVEVEKLWEDKIINSKECLEKEFALVPDLTPELIENYIKTVEIDPYFKEFYEKITKNADFVVVSDGVDYFINRICSLNGIDKIKIFSNHGEFINDEFKLTYPNTNINCKKASGTCKCKIVTDLKEKYEKIYYIGDGTSDYCVIDKGTKAFGKEKLYQYCKKNNIKCTKFENFKDLLNLI